MNEKKTKLRRERVCVGVADKKKKKKKKKKKERTMR